MRPWAVAAAGLLLIAAVTLALGWVITGGDGAPGWVERTDETIVRDIAERRTSRLDAVAEGATQLSDPVTVVALLVGATLVLVGVRRWRELTLLFVGLGGEVAIYLVVGFLVDRERPDVAMGTEVTPGYPSGHVAAAIALYAGLATVVAWLRPDDDLRPLWAVVVAVIVALAASRLYLGIHYPSDVVVGIPLGVACYVVARRTATAAFPDG